MNELRSIFLDTRDFLLILLAKIKLYRSRMHAIEKLCFTPFELSLAAAFTTVANKLSLFIIRIKCIAYYAVEKNRR